MREKWSLSKLPPEGHPDVGQFFWEQFESAITERERLFLPDRWLENHRLWRGGSVDRGFKKKQTVTANLIFANINRTVANLTAKNPSAEVISLDSEYLLNEDGEPLRSEDGEPIKDDTAAKVTSYLKTWWNESEQELALVDTTMNMEIFGPTFEKAVYNLEKNQTEIVIADVFSMVIPAGNYSSTNDMPFIGQAYPERPDAIESKFDLEEGTVNVKDTYSLTGQEREDNRPSINDTKTAPYGTTITQYSAGTKKENEALIVELFVRDNSKKAGELIYPGGIRFVSITNEGDLVLVDKANPNVNPALEKEQQPNTFLYDHFPYWQAVSYRDPSTVWGFAAAEQVGDLAEKIGEMLSRMYRYVAMMMMPTLILPQDTGLNADDIDTEPGLILEPISSVTSSGIRYMAIPSLPADFMRLYEILLGLFDRAYQIEDADRGDTPNRIIAASAIVALQERNAVLMRHKIRQVDYLIRMRGRAALSNLQNFGVQTETVKVGDDIESIRGVDLVNRKFAYVVESGSTIAQTSLQVQEQALDLAKDGHIDSRALLEAIDFPNTNEIVERMAESGDALEQATQAFIQAGVDPEIMQEILTYAEQTQGGPGDANI